MLIGKVIYVVVSLAFSIFYGCRSVSIFINEQDPLVIEKKKLWSWRFHQFWLNFVGSITGWFAAYYLVFMRILPLSSFSFKLEDTVLIIIALLGISGLLPYTLSKITSFK